MRGKPSTSWAPHPKTQSSWFIWFFPPADIQAQAQQTQFPCARSCEQTESFDNREWAERLQPWSSSHWRYYHLLLPLRYQQHKNTRWLCLVNSQSQLGQPSFCLPAALSTSLTPIFFSQQILYLHCLTTARYGGVGGIMDFTLIANHISSGSFYHSGTYQTVKWKLNWNRTGQRCHEM